MVSARQIDTFHEKWDLLQNITVSSCFILPKLMASLGLIVGFT